VEIRTQTTVLSYINTVPAKLCGCDVWVVFRIRRNILFRCSIAGR